VTVDTDKDVVVVHDGSTAGGIPLAKEASVLPLAGGTMTGDVSLGDNVKANFGAGDDLQICHGGSHSYIKDSGTGHLKVLCTDLKINNTANDKAYLSGSDGAGLSIYYDGAEKLATTSTGIDVTGSVTCDGFTSTGIDDNATSTAVKLDSVGNVGIGTNSPNRKLTVNGTAGTLADFTSTITTGAGISLSDANTSSNYVRLRAIGNDMQLYAGNSERMRITSAGNVEVKTGNLVIGTSGKGIDFSAATPDGTGTTGSEVLDDYETGTWTPVLAKWTGGVISATYSAQEGTYTKVGNLITLNFRIATTAIASQGTSIPYISGLPFTVTVAQTEDSTGNFNLSTGLVDGLTTFTIHSDKGGALITKNVALTAWGGGDFQAGQLSGSITYINQA
jgi:hypothetical protein